MSGRHNWIFFEKYASRERDQNRPHTKDDTATDAGLLKAIRVLHHEPSPLVERIANSLGKIDRWMGKNNLHSCYTSAKLATLIFEKYFSSGTDSFFLFQSFLMYYIFYQIKN